MILGIARDPGIKLYLRDDVVLITKSEDFIICLIINDTGVAVLR